MMGGLEGAVGIDTWIVMAVVAEDILVACAFGDGVGHGLHLGQACRDPIMADIAGQRPAEHMLLDNVLQVASQAGGLVDQHMIMHGFMIDQAMAGFAGLVGTGGAFAAVDGGGHLDRVKLAPVIAVASVAGEMQGVNLGLAGDRMADGAAGSHFRKDPMVMDDIGVVAITAIRAAATAASMYEAIGMTVAIDAVLAGIVGMVAVGTVLVVAGPGMADFADAVIGPVAVRQCRRAFESDVLDAGFARSRDFGQIYFGPDILSARLLLFVLVVADPAFDGPIAVFIAGLQAGMGIDKGGVRRGAPVIVALPAGHVGGGGVYFFRQGGWRERGQKLGIGGGHAVAGQTADRLFAGVRRIQGCVGIDGKKTANNDNEPA